jgi:hypothetical protein
VPSSRVVVPKLSVGMNTLTAASGWPASFVTRPVMVAAACAHATAGSTAAAHAIVSRRERCGDIVSPEWKGS